MKTLLVTKGTRPIIDHVETGRRARRYRLSKGIPMNAVATGMGLSTSYLCDLELGRRNWSEDLVRRYQEAVK